MVVCSQIEYLSNSNKKEENPFKEMSTKVESDLGQQLEVGDILPF